ncbi:MAG: hypothetical protein DI529_12725 [Chryseobacterium sp.]|nr:MAG: hypothetical protein DI529_12725 [Chryseobacterium sp.]
MRLYRLLYIFFILCFFISYSQKRQTLLQKKIQENSQLLLKDPDMAFTEMQVLLKEAIKEKDSISELTILGNQCWYYDNKYAYGKSIETAKHLEAKAKQYKQPQMEAMAHLSLMNTYSQNSLYDAAIKEFEKGMYILSKTNPDDNRTLFSKINLYFTINDVYVETKRPYKALDNLFQAQKLIGKIKDSATKNEMQILNFSNVGQVYTILNSDSAKYYAKKSMDIIPKGYENGPYMFSNYLTLGEVYRKEKKYETAYENYKNAEASKSVRLSLINQIILYKGLAETSKVLGRSEDYNKYNLLLKNAELSVAENKNKSLHNIISRKLLEDENKVKNILVISSLMILICLMGLLYFKIKNQRLIIKEEESRENLQEKYDVINKDLILMLEKKDSTFMISFNKVFPSFTKKLLAINSTLVQSEIEFCAFLKLNLSSKEIARIKNIEPKTVQNKKNRIRKRLSIPQNTDIYHWFNNVDI